MVTREAFERTAQELLPVMYKVAVSIVRSEQDAKDAMQQALLNVWERRESVRVDTFRAYLMRIVMNECRNIQRRRMRVFPADLPPVSRDAVGEYSDVHEALYQLPETLRLPLMLKYLHGFSEKEASQALHIPVTTFKSRLHRARKALRKILDREVVFE